MTLRLSAVAARMRPPTDRGQAQHQSSLLLHTCSRNSCFHRFQPTITVVLTFSVLTDDACQQLHTMRAGCLRRRMQLRLAIS